MGAIMLRRRSRARLDALERLVFGCALVSGYAWMASPQHARAGTPELFASAWTHGSTVLAPYIWGGGGMYISNDGGAHYRVMCSTAMDSDLYPPRPQARSPLSEVAADGGAGSRRSAAAIGPRTHVARLRFVQLGNEGRLRI